MARSRTDKGAHSRLRRREPTVVQANAEAPPTLSNDVALLLPGKMHVDSRKLKEDAAEESTDSSKRGLEGSGLPACLAFPGKDETEAMRYRQRKHRAVCLVRKQLDSVVQPPVLTV